MAYGMRDGAGISAVPLGGFNHPGVGISAGRMHSVCAGGWLDGPMFAPMGALGCRGRSPWRWLFPGDLSMTLPPSQLWT